jgi:hypothetical protein
VNGRIPRQVATQGKPARLRLILSSAQRAVGRLEVGKLHNLRTVGQNPVCKDEERSGWVWLLQNSLSNVSMLPKTLRRAEDG